MSQMLKTEKNKSKGKKLGAKLVSVILTLNLLAAQFVFIFCDTPTHPME